MVPEGLKNNSSIGTIPLDWRVMCADALSLKVTKGTTPPKSEVSEQGEIPFLRVNNLSFNGALDQDSSFIYVSKKSHESFLSRSMSYPGDILMNIVGPPLGKTALLDASYSQYNMNQAIVFYRLDPNLICAEYFLAFLNSYKAQTWLQIRSKKTSGQRNLTIELCKQLPTPVPALPEQRKIAKILQTWDRAIATTEKLIDASKQQKKALMQQLLTGKKRFAGFEGEWEVVTLGSLALNGRKNFIDGDWIESPYISDSGCRLIQTGNIGVGEFRDKNSKYISELSFEELRCTEVKVGDLLICRLAEPAGRACVVPELHESKMLTSVDVSIVKIDANKTSPKYLAAYFSLNKTLYDVSALCGGSTRSRISRTNLEKMTLPIASLLEQEKINQVIAAAAGEITRLHAKLTHLKKEKKALMQQLLTGKRRVEIDD